MTLTGYDDLMTRCPRLGGEVTFAYCRIEQGRLPCSRLVSCWQPAIPVEGWLREALAADELDRFVNAPAKDRIAVLADIVDALKSRQHP